MRHARRAGLVALCSIVVLIAQSTRAADPPAITEAIDAGGHTGRIWKVLFTRGGQTVVTVSEDKTIRLWDVASGVSRTVLRMPGPGRAEGRLYAAALAPDGQHLAVAGYGLTGGLHFIYLVSLQSNEIVKTFNGHSDVVDTLAFSPDGKKLLSGSHDQTARLWDVETRQTDHLLTAHTGEVYCVAFSPDGKLGATAAFDKSILIWDLSTGAKTATLTGHTAEVRSVVWSKDGSTIVTGAEDGTIRTWSPDGKPGKTFDGLGSRTITSVSLFEDGSRVLFTQGYGEGPRSCGILNLADGQVTAAYTGHVSMVLDGAVSPDGGLAATAGADDYQVVLWRTTDGQAVQKLAAQGRRIWAVGWSLDGTRIGWGHTNSGRSLAGNMPLENTFDLKVFGYRGAPEGTYQTATLQQGEVGVGGFEDNAVIFQAEKGDPVRVELADPADRLNCVTLFPEQKAVIASDAGMMLYDTKTGKPLHEFVGHTGRVRAISASPNGKYLLSGAEDMTLRIWDLEHESPLMSIFPGEQAWIAWTPEGYYVSSAGGERLAGWRIDNGLNRFATFLPAAQAHKGLFRADVLRELLVKGSVQEAIAATGGGKETDIRNALPPTVQITAVEGPQGDTNELTLEVVAIQQGSAPIVSMQVVMNGRPLGGRAGRLDFEKPAAQVRQNLVVPLTPGMSHELIVRADTELSYGLSTPVRHDLKAADGMPLLPRLHVLAIGVSEYQSPDLKREIAAVDVQAVGEAFRQRSAGLFQDVVVKMLRGQDATRAGILGAISTLRKEMTAADTAVIYLSGLGQWDDTGAFILPYDTDPESLIVTALPDTQFLSMMPGIPGRVIVLLDLPLPDGTPAQQHVGNIVRGLSHDDVGILAAGTGSPGPAGDAGQPSLFAQAIVEAVNLSDGVSADNRLSTTELIGNIRRRLSAKNVSLSIGEPSLVTPQIISQK